MSRRAAWSRSGVTHGIDLYMCSTTPHMSGSPDGIQTSRGPAARSTTPFARMVETLWTRTLQSQAGPHAGTRMGRCAVRGSVLRTCQIDGLPISIVRVDLGDVGLCDLVLAGGEVFACRLHHDARRCRGLRGWRLGECGGLERPPAP